MNEEININDTHSNFDFKSFLMKLLSYWPFFLITFSIAFSIAYYINVRKLPIYILNSIISIKEDQNPFFTTNTSLTFNWGGTTDKVNTAIVTLRSRSHTEKVIEKLQFYLTYKIDGKYQKVTAYKRTPFMVKVDTSQFQVYGKELRVQFKDSVTFKMSATFTDGNIRLQNYNSKEKKSKYFEANEFSREYKLGEQISLPFFSGTFVPIPYIKVNTDVVYYLNFLEFNRVVKNFSRLLVKAESDGSSVLILRFTHHSKAIIVDYINTSVQVLSENMLRRKNLFATKTIRFIDSTLSDKSKELLSVEDELNDFKNKNFIFNLETEGQEINNKLNALDLQKERLNREINYYNVLENYLIDRDDYREVPAPSVTGILEGSIGTSVGKIIDLSVERNKLKYTYREGAPIFKDIDRQINAVKDVLLENITSSKEILKLDLTAFNREIVKYEFEIRKLPKEQQELLKIQRRYNLSEGSYNLFLAKRSEAGLIKAANVSEVLVIDQAKDTGGGRIVSNTSFNYVIAAVFGALIPLIFVFLKSFFDTRIVTVEEIERLTKIPVLGIIRKSPFENNLAVLRKPKSSVAESFRSIRSSLQFIFKKQGVISAKTLLITSSISGEGKTFCAINIASVFALSGKKTIIIGLDLRKPKIFGEFNIDNSVGIVNYLIYDVDLHDIIQKTELEHLNVITSGPIPPNPSELLMGDRMKELITDLKKEYDYIVLDSPPLGLVSDALELSKYVDATLYLARQNFTKRGMFGVINDKYKTGEIKNISIVLNFFEGKARYGYGYEYGYGYGYSTYGGGYYEDGIKPSIIKRIKRFMKKRRSKQ